MIGIALVLVAVGTADLAVGGLVGHPPRRVGGGIAAGAAAAALAALALHGRPLAAVATGVVGAVAVTAWILVRRAGAPPALALASLPGVVLLAAVVTPAPTTRGGAVATVLARLGVGTGAEQAVLALGVTLVLLATANAVVRLVLAAAGPDVARSEDRLQGGRLIGAVERLIVTGLAASGQPGAAALVVAAKAIVRFPELSSAARRDEGAAAADGTDPLARVDAVTEYFLLGSLTSLGVALLAGWLLAA